MKITFTLLFLYCTLHCFSQPSARLTTPPPNKDSLLQQAQFRIIIESLPGISGQSDELNLDLNTKGVYSFVLHSALIVPTNYRVVIQDLTTGNSFDVQSTELHYFSVNRPMTKKFSVYLQKTPTLPLSHQAALKILLY